MKIIKPMDKVKGFLLIADISGFTEFIKIHNMKKKAFNRQQTRFLLGKSRRKNYQRFIRVNYYFI